MSPRLTRPFAVTLSLACASAMGLNVHAQTTPVAPAPAATTQARPLDVPKLLAQTLSEQDVELVMSVFRDALQGKPMDEAKLAPLTQKLEGVAGTVMRDVVAQSIVVTEQLESHLKRELRRLKEQNTK